jgi:hypothetical protein
VTTRSPNTGDGGSVVVAMALAQCPGRGGHAWAVLSYLLGFRRLGWRVTLVDRLPRSQFVDGAGRPVTPGRSVGYRYARAVLAAFGLAEDYVLLVDGDDEPLGRSRSALVSDLARADFLLNVMGFLDDPALRDEARCRAFLDIDPGFPQMWAASGLADVTADHDVHLTVGTGVGTDGCSVPTLGVRWRTTLPPVVLDQWPVSLAPGRAVTSVVTWRGPFDPVEHDGTRYGLRAHQFRGLAGVATGSPWPLELALDIDPEDHADRAMLVAAGWDLVDPAAVAATPSDFRRYVRGSTAEFLVAKGMYVQTGGGWVSDRSACYLASGRPVVAQDTGLAAHLPVGDGLVVFDDVAGARSCLDDVHHRYAHHAAAARSLAEDHFDSDRVLSRLVDSVLEPA